MEIGTEITYVWIQVLEWEALERKATYARRLAVTMPSQRLFAFQATEVVCVSSDKLASCKVTFV